MRCHRQRNGKVKGIISNLIPRLGISKPSTLNATLILVTYPSMTGFFVIACLHPIITLHSLLRALHHFIAKNQAFSHMPCGEIAGIVWLPFWPCWLTLFAERNGTGAGQQPRWAGLLLPVLSSWVPLLSTILRAPGRLLAISLLLPGRTGHLSDCHALQLVDSTNAGTNLRIPEGTNGAMLLRGTRRPASFIRNVTYMLKTFE